MHPLPYLDIIMKDFIVMNRSKDNWVVENNQYNITKLLDAELFP